MGAGLAIVPVRLASEELRAERVRMNMRDMWRLTVLRGIARLVLPIINKMYTIALGVKSLGGSSSLICVELRRHEGEAVTLSDGCRVRPGDPVIKLHLNGAWFDEQEEQRSASQPAGFPRGVTRYFRDGFKLLATQVADGRYGGVIAVYGWTVLHGPARRLGFQVMELPNTLRIRIALSYIAGLMQIYRLPWVKRYRASRRPLRIKAVWLSRADLLKMYRSYAVPFVHLFLFHQVVGKIV